ncbi:MAG: CPBP family intramembrane metalloprotease [Gammaproteobacteria bacterium]|nr:CPBP family intramembrane metalloprotease [Gammaproteobacteria bacterium]NNL99638.1 CPBP family intramembrane metalloprotease [Gammaproteobacteria bacterium]
MEPSAQTGFDSTAARLGEILLVVAVAGITITAGWALVGDGMLARQGVLWIANVLMLLTVYAGLRVRGQGWAHFGLDFGWPGWRAALVNVLKSLAVCVVALAAFMLGAVLMVVITGQGGAPEKADMSSYAWLQGNLPMFLVALAAVYLVSSFGEEVIYRGFLINRIAELGGNGRAAIVVAVLISSVVFGLIHFGWGPVGIVQTTLMGLALAVAYLLLKRRLSILVLAHAYMDTLLLLPIYLSPAPGAAG